MLLHLLWMACSGPVIFDPFGGLDFGVAPDLATDGDGLGAFVFGQYLQSIYQACAGQDIAADADTETLAKTGAKRRCSRFTRYM